MPETVSIDVRLV